MELACNGASRWSVASGEARAVGRFALRGHLVLILSAAMAAPRAAIGTASNDADERVPFAKRVSHDLAKNEAICSLQPGAALPGDDPLVQQITASVLARRRVQQNAPSAETERIRAEAVKWVELGIAKNLPSAYQAKGEMLYCEGHVFESLDWFSRAVTHGGVGPGAYWLAVACSGRLWAPSGERVEPDDHVAQHWFGIASRAGHAEATREMVRRWDERLRADHSPPALRDFVSALDHGDDRYLQQAMAAWRRDALLAIDDPASTAQTRWKPDVARPAVPWAAPTPVLPIGRPAAGNALPAPEK